MLEFRRVLFRSDGTVSSETELVEQISDRLQAGDQVDLAEIQREHPEAAEQIGQLLPAVELLAELGLAASRRESAPRHPHSGNPLPKASSTLLPKIHAGLPKGHRQSTWTIRSIKDPRPNTVRHDSCVVDDGVN